jgi:signal transduction histidine kinase
MVRDTMWRKLLGALPRGYDLEEADWQRRHRMLLWVLAVHIPGLAAFGLFLGHSPLTVASVLVAPAACVGMGIALRRHRRTASVLVTAGLVYCSAALVGLSYGSIEAHFHFFIIIGFIALYQDWAPFLFNILFTVVSHGIGSAWQQSLIFSTASGQANPWLWSLIHGVAVLFACVGMMLFWRVTEDSQHEKDTLSRRLAEAEIGRQRFTSDLLTNLARRNQSLLYRQLEIINQLEESEQDPDALAELFTLDHLATRVRRNAENLLVLSGEQPPRTWSEPVPLRDVLRAAIAETEDLDRVVFVVDERPAVAGHTVTDLTHLIAELTENAVRFSPPDTTVTIRARPGRREEGGYLITVEDWGVGMPPDDLADANALLATPPEVDLSVSQRLGFHVVARLAARHGVRVTLGATPGSGITAVVVLPAALFAAPAAVASAPAGAPGRHVDGHRTDQWPPAPVSVPARRDELPQRAHAYANGPVATRTIEQQIQAPFGTGRDEQWTGWWSPDAQPAAQAPVPAEPVAVYSTASYRQGPPAAVAAGHATPVATHNAPGQAPRPAPTVPTPTLPAPRGGPAPARPVSPRSPESAPGGLRRRIPQSHLNAQLRQPVPDPASDVPPQRTTADAADALSRYQASRAAAQAATEQGRR